eukprot:gene12000-13914_t
MDPSAPTSPDYTARLWRDRAFTYLSIMDSRSAAESAVTTEGTTPGKLYIAVQNGDLEGIREIILSATAEDNQRTALAYAAISGRCDVLQEILKHPGTDPNLPNKFGVSPLMSAMTAEVTQMLLAHPKVDANAIGKEGSFRIACQEGEVEIVRVFLRLEHFNVNAVKEGRVTGLMLATNNKHVAVIEALLTHPEIDVNAQDNDGATALMFAKDVAVVEALLRHPEIDVNIQDKNGYSALIGACDDVDSHEIIPLLLSQQGINVNLRLESGCTALLMMCARGHTDAVKLLLVVPSIDVNLPNSTGYSPLIKVADQGRTEICTMLLRHPDIDANAQSEDGFTALICAAQNGHVEIVKALLDFGCVQPSASNNKDWAALCPASIDRADVRALLQNRVLNVPFVSKAGYIAFNKACDNLHVKIAKMLFAIPGIDVNAENEEENTPLTVACFKGAVEIVEMLLAHLDIDVNKGKFPPLVAACASAEASVEVVKLLLARPEMDVNKVMTDGACTALLMACNFNHTEIVRTILEMSDNVDVDLLFQLVEEEQFNSIVNEEIQGLIRRYRARHNRF